jgi:hypothetical protein
MDWKEALDGTIRDWKQIRASIGSGEEVALLADINAECDLCRVASSASETSLHRCESCLGFQSFGGCHQANLAMTEMVIDKDWDRLRTLVDDFIVVLEDIETTPEKPNQ